MFLTMLPPPFPFPSFGLPYEVILTAMDKQKSLSIFIGKAINNKRIIMCSGLSERYRCPIQSKIFVKGHRVIVEVKLIRDLKDRSPGSILWHMDCGLNFLFWLRIHRPVIIQVLLFRFTGEVRNFIMNVPKRCIANVRIITQNLVRYTFLDAFFSSQCS